MSVEDNVPAGADVVVPSKLFLQLFGDDIVERWNNRKATAPACIDETPSK